MMAGSSMSGRLVAPMTKTDFLAPTPSISVRIWLTTRSPASEAPPPPPLPRGLAIESISSKKRTHGAAPRALSKRSRTLDSDSPNHIVSSSGPLTEMKLALHLVGDGLGEQRLAAAGRAVEEHALGRRHAEALKLARRTDRVLHGLAQLALDVLEAAHVLPRARWAPRRPLAQRRRVGT